MTLGIVLPAYDPDGSVLQSYVSDLQQTVGPERVHVELDGPTSSPWIDRIRDQGVTVRAVPERRGKGAAIAAGFDRLETDRLAFVDADGSTPAPSVADVVGALDRGDLAVGSRRHPDADVVTDQSPLRTAMGDAFAWSARRVIDPPLFDYQCGAKAIDRETWQAVRDHLDATGFAWDLELVAFAHALGHEVVEVPVDWSDHPDSTVDPFSTAIELGATLLSVRSRTARLSRSDRPGTPERGRRDPAAGTNSETALAEDRAGE